MGFGFSFSPEVMTHSVGLYGVVYVSSGSMCCVSVTISGVVVVGECEQV